MRIWVDENIPGREVFSVYGEVRTFAGRALRHSDLYNADALLVRSVTRVDRDLLDGTPVAFVGTATIGVNHVDQGYLRGAGIGFASAPGCNARSVAEYVVAALLHLQAQSGLPLAGRTLGIVGCGHVGGEVARLAPALGLKILRCDPPRAEAGHAGPWLNLAELSARSDIITWHVPLIETGRHSTRALAGSEFFQGLSRPMCFLNTSRGEAVDESALLRACDRGLISHLVLDVFAGEPDIDSSLVQRADLATPHIAGYSVQGKLNGTRQILAAFCRHFHLQKTREPEYPSPARPEIDYQPGKSAEFNLLHCVTHAYAIARDDEKLKSALKNPDKPAPFDSLRRNYPARFEFPSFRIRNIPAPDFLLRERLQGLGFFLES